MYENMVSLPVREGIHASSPAPFVYSIIALPMRVPIIFLSLASIADKLLEDLANKEFQLL